MSVEIWIQLSTQDGYSATIEGACPNGEDEACLRALVMGVIVEKGLREGFVLVKNIYMSEPHFRPLCHRFALSVGFATAEVIPDYTKLSYTPESVWCNYGFYQAYPQSLLLRTGDVKRARSFCEYIGIQLGSSVPGAKSECFRGIGRALPFVNNADLGDPRRMAAFATRTCKTISPGKDEYIFCTSGAFNQLGREAVAKSYGLSVNVADPVWLCREQPKDLQGSCYASLHWPAFSLVEHAGDFTQKLHEVDNIYGATSTPTLETIWTLGYEEGRKSVAKDGIDEAMILACASLPASLMVACIQGISVGLVKHGTPGSQHLEVIRFCAKAINDIPTLKKTDCPLRAITYLEGFYSPSQFENACKDFRKELDVSCE